MPPLFITDAHEGVDRILRPVGELDLANASQFDLSVSSALADGAVVVDLGAVDFMDSAGLRVLLRAARAANGRLRLRSPQHIVQRLFDVSGAGALLPLE
jgi:anti-sigma B factor antagonist